MLKDISGKGQIFWGNEEQRPAFWPQEVPFENPKTKPAVYSNMVEWKQGLCDVLIALYESYGYDPKIWTKEMVSVKSLHVFSKVAVDCTSCNNKTGQT